jgi:hypothetical protein
MSKTAIPTVYPREGAYELGWIHIDLSCATPNARIHYTLDGSEPTEKSPVYIRSDGVIPLKSPSEKDTTITVKAFSEADGGYPGRNSTTRCFMSQPRLRPVLYALKTTRPTKCI